MRFSGAITAAPVYVVAAAVILAGCGTSARAPVSGREPARNGPPASVDAGSRPDRSDGTHIVAAGDTLYSIAWRYGHDYRDVARWNAIGPPYLIVPGRVIRLTPPSAATVPGTTRQPRPPASPAPPASAPAAIPMPADRPLPENVSAPIQWRWPAEGQLLRSDSPTSKKGVDIAGRVGQSITAAASGSVVYSGSGLLGYGRLIIIKHNDTYLSAYAHNEMLLVKEGDQVSSGQRIATMGLGISGRPVLHFEIRKDGKPVNPLEHLPKTPS
ncbi:MAG: peptidoglycan DD-metalloendopeptidase family protein [Gammaproteobacteria bacterium]|nr:peptidoglycan DD-metalloendopeptidase family protein [Gammaproteobacteria bacterium]